MFANHTLGKLPRIDWERVEDFGLRFSPWNHFGDVKFFHCFLLSEWRSPVLSLAKVKGDREKKLSAFHLFWFV